MAVKKTTDISSDERVFIVLNEIVSVCVGFMAMVSIYLLHSNEALSNEEREEIREKYSLIKRIPKQIKYLRSVTGVSDRTCIDHLRMNRGAFSRLCHLLENTGELKSTRNSSIWEQVAMFLSVIAHHTKNCIVKSNHTRSGRTVSKNFHKVLNAVIKLHSLLLARPEPIDSANTNFRWKHFKGCLGALDGSYINVTVPRADQPRYRNRKGQISVNVLSVCDIHMNFIYVLTGWEGSANDSRVLRDALSRDPGFHVPSGNYYLCDGGYPNGEGFLAPYRGVRYHLKEWGTGADVPRNKEEFFNMKHAQARNVIERAFGVLKKRWAILQNASFYPIRVQNRIILACCLLHNFIRLNMVDPLEDEVFDNVDNMEDQADDHVEQVESTRTQQWRNWRDEFAASMYNEWIR